MTESSLSPRPELETILSALSDTQLRRIIRAVAADQPAFAAAIRQQVQWLMMEPGAGAGSATPPVAHSIAVDIAAIRREIGKDFRRIAATGGGSGYSDHYWDDDSGGFDPDEVLQPHKETANQLLAAGDAATATAVITALIEEWSEGIADLDEWIAEANVDVFSETEQELGALLAEALLSQDLSPEQLDQWLARVQDWSEDLIDLEIATTALDQWWDYPPLVAAMQGNITEQGAWEGEAPYFADELTLVRLRILERQERTQEYMHLAEAEGQTSLYINMLARTGQVEQAVAEARKLFSSPVESLTLATVLIEQNAPAAALGVATHGLDLPEQQGRQELARWTVALAEQMENPVLALRAAQAAFTSSYALADYQVAERLAGAEWPAIKPRLLERMEQSMAYYKVDIYLYEHMLVEAMAQVDRLDYRSDLERVIQATRAEFPDWGIEKCKRQAENIMDAGKASAYASAAAWLRIAHDIYFQHNRQAEWQAYLARVLDLHARKYKLVPMLRAIR